MNMKTSLLDMVKNFDCYKIEELQAPTLILYAKDDKMASYAQAEKAIRRFPNRTLINFIMTRLPIDSNKAAKMKVKEKIFYRTLKLVSENVSEMYLYQ
jgi:alpha-beta hydrolase superfamily lysophospholipase